MASITYETPDGAQTKEAVDVRYKDGDGHWEIREDEEHMTIIPRERVYSVRKESLDGGGEEIEW